MRDTSRSWRKAASLCRLFLVQDLQSRFTGSLLGAAWSLVAPLLQLAVFYVVFLHIFKARVPGLEPDAYLVFLALGFWPWFAFSESITRAATAVQDHGVLASKIALPRSVPVIARVLSSFLVHGVGFAAVLLVLLATGSPMHWSALPSALLLWIPLLALALGIGLIAAAVQVFVRDLAQSIGPLMSMWFFLTPIVYAIQMTPFGLAQGLLWNPVTAVVEGQRSLLLFGTHTIPGWPAMMIGAVLAPILGIWLFRRLSPWFEDYL